MLTVYSAAMGRNIDVEVLLPKDRTKRHPVLYLLNGGGGGEDSATWTARTDVESFFSDKDVYVVTPIGGAFSYYTDWIEDDPVIGRQKWATFLTHELPPLIDDGLGTTGRNAIAGISMAGTSVLNLAIANPGLYEVVGSYSGCAMTSGGLGQQYIRMVVEGRGGADTTNMWGPYDGQGWKDNDPFINAEKLRGTAIYISTGTGMPGEHDKLNGFEINGNPIKLLNQTVVGGVIEAATYQCTKAMLDKLEELGIPVTEVVRDGGTHSWGYWQDDLHDSWPMFAQELGLTAQTATAPATTPAAKPAVTPAAAAADHGAAPSQTPVANQGQVPTADRAQAAVDAGAQAVATVSRVAGQAVSTSPAATPAN